MADRADQPDAQANVILQMIEEQPAPGTYAVTARQAREQMEEMMEMLEGELEFDAVHETQDFDIEGPDGPVPVRAYIPRSDGPTPVVVFVHGGGWVTGNPDTHDHVSRAIASRGDVIVLSVDYRLAPEHTFPAALEDTYAAVEWASEHADDLGGDPDSVAVAGDSAGGNLSAAVSLMARDREDGPDIAHQGLIYPAVASPIVHEFESQEENAEGYLLERKAMEYYYEKYVDDDIHGRNEYLAPLLARDLEDLPPATIITGGYDPLCDEAVEYAKRLEEAGVSVEHDHYDGQIHAFVQLLGMIDEASEAVDNLVADLKASLK
jgi:acetyl esterase